MYKLGKEIIEFLNFIDSGIKKICIFFAGMMTITVILQILFRYILKNPLIWTEELSRYLMIWMSFIGASSVLKRWENVKVDFFIDKINNKARRFIKLIIKILIFLFLIYLFLLCIQMYPKVSANQATPAMGIKMIYPQLGIIIGTFLMSLQMVGLLIKEIIEGDLND